MVATVDGKVAVGGRVRGIGSRLDRELMRRIRAAADALMVGGATVRAEPIDPRIPEELAASRRARGQPEQPLVVTLSRGLELDPSCGFFRLGAERTLVFTSAAADPTRAAKFAERARIERLGTGEVDLGVALRSLRNRHGVERLLVEGGPTLNQALLDRDALDELFVTIAPKLAGGSGPALLTGPAPPTHIAASLELLSLFESEGELFARYRVERS